MAAHVELEGLGAEAMPTVRLLHEHLADEVLGVEQVDRELDEHRPWDSLLGDVEGLLDGGADAAHLVHRDRPFCDGLHDGNLVDVFVTVQNPDTKLDTTKLVLDKIPVLATGQEIKADGKKNASPVDVYTLEVTPEEGEKLALAATQGKLQFALRNITDSETVLTRGATIAATLRSLSNKTQRKPGPKPRRVYPRLHTMEIITGDKIVKRKMRL